MNDEDGLFDLDLSGFTETGITEEDEEDESPDRHIVSPPTIQEKADGASGRKNKQKNDDGPPAKKRGGRQKGHANWKNPEEYIMLQQSKMSVLEDTPEDEEDHWPLVAESLMEMKAERVAEIRKQSGVQSRNIPLWLLTERSPDACRDKWDDLRMGKIRGCQHLRSDAINTQRKGRRKHHPEVGTTVDPDDNTQKENESKGNSNGNREIIRGKSRVSIRAKENVVLDYLYKYANAAMESQLPVVSFVFARKGHYNTIMSHFVPQTLILKESLKLAWNESKKS